MEHGKWRISWVDRGREPKCPPNPKYPLGIDIDCSDGAKLTCSTKLEYPAKRCGVYLVQCMICGKTAGVTTAGRPDDPRMVRLACAVPETTQ